MHFERAGSGGERSVESTPAHGPAPGKQTLTQSLVVQRSALDATTGSAGPAAPGPSTTGPSTGLAAFSTHLSGLVQRKSAEGSEPSRASPDQTFARATSGGGGEIPYRAQMERAFGQDFGGVRAHLGQAEPMKDISARAATQGENIAFATSSPDVHLVAHELTHVVQNRVHGDQPVAAKSGMSHPGDASEVEADAIADRVASGGSVAGALGQPKQGCATCCDDCAGDQPVQRAAEPGAPDPAAKLAERRAATARIASLVDAGLPHVRKISSPTVAAQREQDLRKHVAILEQHRDDPAVGHGDHGTEARAAQHLAQLEHTQGRLATAASRGGAEPHAEDAAHTASPRAAAKPAPATGKDAGHDHAARPATPTVQRQVIQRSPECDDLLQEIIDLINELKGRFSDLVEDPQHLQWDNWSTSNPKPGVGSVEGHQMQFRQKQTRLRNKLNDWNTDNCGDGGGGLPADAWQWATRPAPDPAPQPRPAPPAPAPSTSSSSSTVWGAIAIGCAIGIGLLLAPEITAPALIFAL